MPVQFGRNENLAWDFLTIEVLQDHSERLLPDSNRELNWVGIDFPVSDRTLAIDLSVESDDLDFVGDIGIFQRRIAT